MNKDWKEFLTSINAQIQTSDNNIESVNNYELSIDEEQDAFENLVLTDLSQYSVIEAKGDDVIDFFQGQFTNDMKLVDNNTSQLNAYCNPKGRILATFRITQQDDRYLLTMHSSIVEATLKRLKMFVMRSKVELRDISDEIIKIGVAGNDAPPALSQVFENLPNKTDESITKNNISTLKLAGDLPRYEIYGSVTDMKQIWETLSPQAKCIGANSWNILTIRAAIPEVVAETVEEFVPQMVNLQAINSLSFTKGCYPGQEVVARMHYLGKLKRRLFIGKMDLDSLPPAGTAIYSQQGDSQKVGQIVTASWSKNNQVELLAVLQIEKAEKGGLHIESAPQSLIELIDLPYSLDEKTEEKG